jgi:uncharacterized protein YydD (DUF2326 family)
MELVSLESDFPTFKTLCFHKGFNILLADQHEESGKDKTRNAVGKTTAIDLVRYLLGGNKPPMAISKEKSLEKAWYGLHYRHKGQEGTIRRCPAEKTKNIQLSRKILNQTSLNRHLQQMLFGLKDTPAYGPTYRACLAYFIRNYFDDYRYAQEDQRNRQGYQVNLAFLFGFDWTLIHRHILNEKRKSGIKKLKPLLKSLSLRGYTGDKSALESRSIILESEIQEIGNDLDNFKVIPEYRELEKEAADLNAQMRRLSAENGRDRDLQRYIENAMASEEPPGVDRVNAVYEEAGLLFPDNIRMQLREVKDFHRRISENRQHHLQRELNAVKDRISARYIQQNGLQEQYSEIMHKLSEGGAFDEFRALQERLTEKQSEFRDIQQQLENLTELKEQEKLYRDRKQELEELIEQSVSEQKELKREVILTFEKISNQLYESAGSLNIRAGEKGLDYEITIKGSGSGGVDKMQVFCFDLTLAIITARAGRNPGFLIHDSRLFDESDERQVASALAVAKKESEANDFQYIAAFNSDRLPNDVLQSYANQLVSPVLDDTAGGGLFGYQF